MFSCDNLLLFLPVEVFYHAWKNLCLLNSENDHEMSQSQTADQQRYHEEETQNILGLGCILL